MLPSFVCEDPESGVVAVGCGTKAKPNTNEIRIQRRMKNVQDENSPEKFEVEVYCGASDSGQGEVKSKCPSVRPAFISTRLGSRRRQFSDKFVPFTDLATLRR